MKQKNILPISIVLSAILVTTGLIFLAPKNNSTPDTSSVREENGTQIISLKAKGGYYPKTIRAKAGLPTVLEVETQNTYDCSSALQIPALSYRKILPANGLEKISLSADKAQGTLRGTCSMGMYGFEISFL